MMHSSDHLPLHLVGTPAFFPAVLSYIRHHVTSASLPLDPVIFQSILLCIVAGDKHLILRTPEEDIGLVVKLVVWTLSTILNFPTHKVKIRPRAPGPNYDVTASTSTSFLRSLFLPSNFSSLSNSNQTSQDESPATATDKMKHLWPRVHFPPSKRKQREQPAEYTRSLSFPSDLAVAAVQTQDHGTLSPRPPLQGYFAEQQQMEPTTGSSSNPFSSASTLKPHFLHAYTNPIPARRKSPLENKLPLEVPRALVISGLENASLSTQRSLVRVLAERRIILEGPIRHAANHRDDDDDEYYRKHPAEDYDGAWNLPDGFILIFVCPLNEKERPAIHKSLLDKFAMSTDILVSQDIRYALRSLPFSPTHAQSHPHFFSHSNPSSPTPTHPISLPQAQTPPIFTKPLPFSHSNRASDKIFPNDIIPASFLDTLKETCRHAHISPTLSLFLSDLFSATRHNTQLDATLLTATAMKDAQDLARAERVLGNDLTGTELVRPTAKFYDDVSEELSELNPFRAGQSRTSDDFSEYVTVNNRGAVSSSSRSTTTTTSSGSSRAPVVLDVSEVDVARIMPRVITHRVKLRDGPEDEVLASAVFGATFGSRFDQDDSPRGDNESNWSTCPPDSDERQEGWSGWDDKVQLKSPGKTVTVKDILVNILGEV